MLGRSYEELGLKSKALRAYFRYLAAFLTATERDQVELLEVLRRMTPLAADASEDANQLGQLLASLTTLDLPEAVVPQVHLVAAKSAYTLGSRAMAESWIAKAMDGPADATTRAKALYVRALIELGRRDFDAADETLSTVIQTDKGGEVRDLARLALARVAVHQRHASTAAKYYAAIEADSPSYRDALFESVYVLLDLKRDAEARAKAMLFVAKFPETAPALQLRTLIAYLDMRAGDLASASKSIEATDQRLHGIDAWLRERLIGQSAVSADTLTEFTTLAGPYVPTTPTVREAMSLFHRIGELGRALADIRGEIRNLTYVLGRGDAGHVVPAWDNRAQQLARLSEDVLAVGHRLAGAERHLYKDRFEAADWQKLSASEARRVRLLSVAAERARDASQWRTSAAFMDLNQGVAEAAKKLARVEAELASARYLAAAAHAKAGAAKVNKLRDLERTAAKLRVAVGKALATVRKQRVGAFVALAPHRKTRKLFAQYAVALHEESETIRKVRDTQGAPATRLNARDAERAWAAWEWLAGEVFAQLATLENDIKSGLSRTVQTLEAAEAQE
jgi:hypothetical protein